MHRKSDLKKKNKKKHYYKTKTNIRVLRILEENIMYKYRIPFVITSCMWLQILVLYKKLGVNFVVFFFPPTSAF